MGPEELAIIMSPQFINATFRAGEDWYYGMLERTQEANRLAQHRHSFEVANARYAVVNHQLLHDAREQNAKWKAFANDLVRKHDDYAVLARRLLDEEIAGRKAETNAKRTVEQHLADEKSRSAGKDNEIAQLKQDWNWFSNTLDTTHAALTSEQQKVAALQAENEKLRAALSAAESDRQRLHEDNAAFLSAADHFEQECKDLKSDLARSQEALQEEEAEHLSLSHDLRDARLVNEALSSAPLLALSLMEQTRALWAAQGKPSMMEHSLGSHYRVDGHPLTVREYLWFATLMREMTAHNVPDHLVSTYCPVAQRGDFLTRPVTIQEKRPD
jgi:DNA repair exonuclease SbcCD ATPase subunit